jgi:hypothetical protein
MKTLALAAAALCAIVLHAAPARADWYVSPFVGATLANSTDLADQSRRLNVGGDVAMLGRSGVGAELDVGYLSKFFGNASPAGSNSVLDVMGNLMVHAAVGSRLRPYAIAGAGLLRAELTSTYTDLTRRVVTTDSRYNYLAVDFGGGLIVSFSRRVGVRGDVRHIHAIHEPSAVADAPDLPEYHFWRASAAIVIR